MRLEKLPSLNETFKEIRHPLYPGTRFLNCKVICKCAWVVNVKVNELQGEITSSTPNDLLRIMSCELERCEFVV